MQLFERHRPDDRRRHHRVVQQPRNATSPGANLPVQILMTQGILAHLHDAPDFSLDQVAQVMMDRWSSGRVGLLGDAGAGFAGYEQRMRDYVEANQDIGRMHVESIIGPGSGAEEGPEPDMEALMPIIERAVGGPQLPEYNYAPTPASA